MPQLHCTTTAHACAGVRGKGGKKEGHAQAKLTTSTNKNRTGKNRTEAVASRIRGFTRWKIEEKLGLHVKLSSVVTPRICTKQVITHIQNVESTKWVQDILNVLKD